MNEFTSTSGAGFNENGSFNVGMEVFFVDQATPAEVIREFDVPKGLTSLTLFGGSAAFRPKDPEAPTILRHGQQYRADALFRITIDDVIILNVILKTSREPANLYVAPFTYTTRPQVPLSDGRKMKIVFAAAATSFPVNMELELCGVWSK